MARMVRKQIVIAPEQETALAKLATDQGVSQSELIRRAIDGLLLQATHEQDKQATHDKLMAFFDEGLPLGLTDDDGKRTWTREDLYDFRGIPRHERDRLRRRSE